MSYVMPCTSRLHKERKCGHGNEASHVPAVSLEVCSVVMISKSGIFSTGEK